MQVLLSHGVSGMGRVGIGHGLYLSTSIAALFSGGVVGLWFDPNDRSTLFQDSAGTFPVTAPGQTTGLMLDKSKGRTLGAAISMTAAVLARMQAVEQELEQLVERWAELEG